MRNFALLALLVCGCGDNVVEMDAAVHDMSMPDLTPPKDFAMPDFAGVACGAMTCGTGDSCCAMVDPQTGMVTGMCMANGTCGSMTFAVMCDGPEDCTAQTCCGTFMFTAQMGSDGGVSGSGSGGSMCVNTCAASFTYNPSSGMGTAHTEFCHTNNDCANLSGMVAYGSFSTTVPFTSCCTRQGVGYSFCAPPPNQQTMNFYTCQQ